MNRLGQASNRCQTLNIGIYGLTSAGKTRFLFQLLKHWERTHRFLEQSEKCQKFLEHVESEIEKHDRSIGTVTPFEGIDFIVRRSGDKCPLKLVLRDLRGEDLAKQIDQLDSPEVKGEIPTQVRQCDGFLFFLDPASSEKPEQIEEHHKDEMERAEKFIKYVIKIRENQLLPIIFVQTHLDLWEKDEKICAMAEDWTVGVHTKLTDLYKSKLQGIYPKSIVDRSRTFVSISSVGKKPEANKELEQVVWQLNDLVAESKTDGVGSTGEALKWLVAGIGVVALCIVAVFVMMWWEGPDHKQKPPSAFAEMKEPEVLKNLDELESLLKAKMRGPQLPRAEFAKTINRHIQWLAQGLNSESGGLKELPDKIQQRMRSALNSVAIVVHDTAENKKYTPSELAPILAAYLDDLPDMTPVSKTFGTVQKRFWQIQRDYVVKEIDYIIKVRNKAGSSILDTYKEVISKIKGMEIEVLNCKVFDKLAQRLLVDEIRTVKTFCEDRVNLKGYPVKISVEEASCEVVKMDDLAWRGLTIRSPGQPDNDYPLKPKEPIDKVLAFETEYKSYQLTLGLGGPVTLAVSLHNNDSDKWDKIFDLDLVSEKGPLTVIGLPLHKQGQTVCRKELQKNGMNLKLVFSDFPIAPTLIWDAAMSSKEKQP